MPMTLLCVCGTGAGGQGRGQLWCDDTFSAPASVSHWGHAGGTSPPSPGGHKGVSVLQEHWAHPLPYSFPVELGSAEVGLDDLGGVFQAQGFHGSVILMCLSSLNGSQKSSYPSEGQQSLNLHHLTPLLWQLLGVHLEQGESLKSKGRV